MANRCIKVSAMGHSPGRDDQIGGCSLHRANAEGAATAPTVVDDDLTLQLLGECVGEDVGAGACRRDRREPGQ